MSTKTNNQTTINQSVNFEAVFEAMPGYSVLLNIDAPVYTILAATHAYLQPSGKTKENTIGKGLFEAFPRNPDDANFKGDINLQTSFHKVIETKQLDVFSHRYDIPNADGGFIESWWRASNQPVLDEKGNVVYIIHTAEDITYEIKAKQNEDKVKGLQQAYNLFMQAPVAIHVIKGDALIIDFANPLTLTLWGKEDDVIGKPLLQALPEIANLGIVDLLHHIRQTEESYEAYEASVDLIRWGKKEKVYVNFNFQPYYEDGNEKASGVLVIATEVTDKVAIKNELKEKETNLQQSEQRFRAAVDAVQGVLWTNDANGEMQGEQPGWSALTGQTMEEYKGYGWSKLVHPDDVQHSLEAWQEALRERKMYVCQHRLKVKNGEWRTFSIRAIPLFNDDNTVREWVGVHTDITEQQKAAQALEQSEKEFRQLAESLPQLVWTTDGKGRQTFVSKRWEDFTGFALMDDETFQKVVHPDDYKSLMKVWVEAIASEKTYKAEVRYKNKNGRYHWFYIQGEPVRNESNKIDKWVGACIDITDRKIAEENLRLTSERFRLLADALPMFVWTTDAEGNLTYINKAESEFTGLTLEELKKKDWLEMIHPDDYDENLWLWKHALKNGENFECERRIRRKDGVYRWRLTRAVPQYDIHGNLQSWLGAGTDIHELHELDEQKDLFIAMVSHELKTPITSIKGYVQMMQQKYSANDDAFLINALATVNKQIGRTTKLISDLLDVSKIKSGRLPLHKEEFVLNNLVQEMINEVHHLNTIYQFHFLEEANALVFADRERIGQVLINLLTNAVKYSPRNKEIKIKTFVTNECISVSVEDFGIGINAHDQKKIFEQFYRVEGTNESKFSGFGIGLFIASQIVQKHNGSITVQSNPGKGSVFSFSLPFEQLLPV